MIESYAGSEAFGARVSSPAPSSIVQTDFTPYLEKLSEAIASFKLPIAEPATKAEAEADLISREAYLINGTLLPLLRFMAHRFRGYRAVNDPQIKGAIARLERVDTLESLIASLEKINVSALAQLTDEKRPQKR